MNPTQKRRILIVDDEPVVREILSRWLKNENHECVTAATADEASQMLDEQEFSILLSDILMPGKSGMELLVETREKHPDVAIIMVTGVDDRKQAVRALELGAYGYIVKPFDEDEVVLNVAGALERRRLVLASRAYEQELEEEVRARTEEIRRHEEEVILRLVWAIESRDRSSSTHARRIGLLSAALAEALDWESDRVDHIRLAAVMHDIGKIGIADGILLKKDQLNSEETALLRKHTEIGAEILQFSEIPLLQMAREIALYHHEKWDGSGYPERLAGEEIPESARIVAVVNTYDNLCRDRDRGFARTEEEIVRLMREQRGKHFDPRILDVFLETLPTFRTIREEAEEGKIM